MKANPFLTSVRVRDDATRADGFPWSVPALGALRALAFPTCVTFLMGENGCGKSTLLEALAFATRAVAVGSTSLEADESFAGARLFADALVTGMSPRKRPSARLFFRAEDALGFGRRLETEMHDLAGIAEGIEADERAGPNARTRAAGFVRGQRRALSARYGDDPHARSHGESFARILDERLVPNGIYFLDEPETPLSPTRVLALMLTLSAAVRAGSQFVIATHSPILCALPGATIYVIDGDHIAPMPYDRLEHVRVTRDFLNAPERYLRLLEADTSE